MVFVGRDLKEGLVSTPWNSSIMRICLINTGKGIFESLSFKYYNSERISNFSMLPQKTLFNYFDSSLFNVRVNNMYFRKDCLLPALTAS